MDDQQRIFKYQEYLKQRTNRVLTVGNISHIAWLAGIYFLGATAIPIFAGIAATISVSGKIFDLKSTTDGLKLGATELNTSMSANPSKKELFSPNQLIKDSKWLVLEMLIPSVGIANGFESFLVGLQNYRQINKFKNRN